MSLVLPICKYDMWTALVFPAVGIVSLGSHSVKAQSPSRSEINQKSEQLLLHNLTFNWVFEEQKKERKA